MSKDFIEDSAKVDMKFYEIINGNIEVDSISECIKNIPDKDIKEEIDFKQSNPIKDLEVNEHEFNIKTLGKMLNMPSQNEENDNKILVLDNLILNTFTFPSPSPSPTPEKVQNLQKQNLQKFYFKKYNSKFKLFISEYANLLLRKKLLCGKIQKPKISLFKYFVNKKKKIKNKISSFTMKKMLCLHKRRNKKIIQRILSFIKKFDSNKKYGYVKSFLSLKIEDAIQKFEESEEFKEFISDKKIIALDKEIKFEKGFSILGKEAYEKMVEMQSEV